MALEATNQLLLRSTVAAEATAQSLGEMLRVQALMAEDTRRMAAWNGAGSSLGGSGWVPQGNMSSVQSRSVPEVIVIDDENEDGNKEGGDKEEEKIVDEETMKETEEKE